MEHHKRSDFIHHKKEVSTTLIREAVFGVEDGMVSTFGAMLGIATATYNPYLVILTGLVIIAVESISMGVGSFLSSRSKKAIEERKLKEEEIEVTNYPKEEKREMEELFVADGWPKTIAKTMADVACKDKTLLLREMSYRELKIFPDQLGSPVKNAFVMWGAYIIGGMIPLSAYFFFDIGRAIGVSIFITLIALFGVGAYTTKFSKRSWVKSGLEMMILASIAAFVGYMVGQLVS